MSHPTTLGPRGRLGHVQIDGPKTGTIGTTLGFAITALREKDAGHTNTAASLSYSVLADTGFGLSRQTGDEEAAAAIALMALLRAVPPP